VSDTAAHTAQRPTPLAPLRDAKGRLLPGGRSLNPSGHSRKESTLRRACRRMTPKVLRRLGEVIQGDDNVAIIRAAELIFAYGFGRPITPTANLNVNMPVRESLRHLITATSTQDQAERAYRDMASGASSEAAMPIIDAEALDDDE
jgi:hypothetical protein